MAKPLICYAINERGGKSYWTRIGVAFVNQDRSINVRLECLPINGELQIREQVDRDERDEQPEGGRRDSRNRQR